MGTNRLSGEEQAYLRTVALHEAGHAVVAMYLGLNVTGLKLSQDLGGTCDVLIDKTQFRSWQAATFLGGVCAELLHCRDSQHFATKSNWSFCHEDFRLFNLYRCGMSFRQCKQLALGILREERDRLLATADVLEHFGVVDYSNAWMVDYVMGGARLVELSLRF